jgi:hypothetical protein
MWMLFSTPWFQKVNGFGPREISSSQGPYGTPSRDSNTNNTLTVEIVIVRDTMPHPDGSIIARL